jgi:hypothetical protein
MSGKNDAKAVFISYAHETGTEVAEALWRALGGEHGEAFLDRSKIKYGYRFAEHIIDALFQARVTVLLPDTVYLQRPYCLFEREIAFAEYSDLQLRPEDIIFTSKIKTREEAFANALRSIIVGLPKAGKDEPGSSEGKAAVLNELPPPLRE